MNINVSKNGLTTRRFDVEVGKLDLQDTFMPVELTSDLIMVTDGHSCVEQHKKRVRSTLCQQVSHKFIDNSKMLRFGMVGSFPRYAWQYALVLYRLFCFFFCLHVLFQFSHSLPLLGLHSHLHIFTGLFPPDFFSLNQLQTSVF